MTRNDQEATLSDQGKPGESRGALLARHLDEFEHEIGVLRAQEIALAEELEAARRAIRELVAIRDELRVVASGGLTPPPPPPPLATEER